MAKNGNLRFTIVKTHIGRSSGRSAWQIYPDEVFYVKDLFTHEGNYLVLYIINIAPKETENDSAIQKTCINTNGGSCAEMFEY